ncbi:MAG: hypothetical protein AB7F36_04880 [Reyranellaceae bacterium]
MKLHLALLLWLSTMILILANGAIGDTIIAAASARAADVYKAVVPLPYVALCAWILARRSSGATTGDALAVGLLWAATTVVADALVARLLQGLSWRLAVVHYRFWDGYLFALVPLAQLAAPAIALAIHRRRQTTA